MPSVEQQHGNAEVIKALEEHLLRARSGQISYAVIATYAEPGTGSCWFGGSAHLLKTMRDAVAGNVVARMDAKIDARALPPRDPALGADHVCYNLAEAPLSFDFLMWLIEAEMTRVCEGAPAPLKVAFWGGRDGDLGLAIPSRAKMFHNVVRPMLALVGAVEDPAAAGGRFRTLFTARSIVAPARAGEPVPTLRAPPRESALMQDFLRGRAPVTITLREAEHWPHRNSDLELWLRIARWLRARGEWVVFVRDTARASIGLQDFDICPGASINLHARVALYEAAKANLFVSNGPASLAWFIPRPWLMFLHIQPDGHAYRPDTPTFWRDSMGIEPGTQLPWSRPDQRIVWGPIAASSIMAAVASIFAEQQEQVA